MSPRKKFAEGFVKRADMFFEKGRTQAAYFEPFLPLERYAAPTRYSAAARHASTCCSSVGAASCCRLQRCARQPFLRAATPRAKDSH